MLRRKMIGRLVAVWLAAYATWIACNEWGTARRVVLAAEVPPPVRAGADRAVPQDDFGDAAAPEQEGKQGLRGVFRALTGGRKPVAAEKEDAALKVPVEPQKEVLDESQKRVNELVRLATTAIEKNRVEEAIKHVNELIAIKPYEAGYHFALGLCYRRQGNYKDALKKYQDVLDLGGPRGLVALLRAEAYAREGDREKAFQHLKEAGAGGRNIIQDVGMLPALASYRQDTEFVRLALQLEKFSLPRGRAHDPFTNPFPKSDRRGQPGAESAPAEQETHLTAEDQEKLLLEARKTYERVKFYIKLEDEANAMKAYASLRELVAKKDLIVIPKLANDFRVLIAQLDGLEVEIEGIRLKYYYAEAKEKLKRMKELFADGEYRRLEAVHAEIVRMVQEMQQVNKNYKSVADQILDVANRWNSRAQVRKEFESRKPAIQGIVIAPEGKMALLNNRLVKQGDRFEEDMRVISVESNKVTFRFKGEDIPVLFRRY